MAIYLSRIVLNLRNRQPRRDLADCYQMHRTVMSLFGATPETPTSDAPRTLYRVEAEGRQATLPEVIIQSSEAPDWSRLAAGYLATGTNHPNPETKRIEAFLKGLDRLPALNFLLVANPTRKIRVVGPTQNTLKAARVEIRDDDTLIEWLRRKAETGGFELLEVRSSRSGAPVFDVSTRTGKRLGKQLRNGLDNRLTFGAVRFVGRLRVTDPRAFLQTVATGIGSGKGFGFGLLSVARAG